jgi:hypothetical protein
MAEDSARKLDELVATLKTLVKCAGQGEAADQDEVRDELWNAVDTLVEGVCEEWAAVCVGSHGHEIYLLAFNTYQNLVKLLSGHYDDQLDGIDVDHVCDKWPEAAPLFLTIKAHLESAEFARVVEEVRSDLLKEQPKPWPHPFEYVKPGKPEDRWSREAAERQRARLAAYREGGPVRRVAKHRTDDADLMKATAGEPADRFVTKLGGLPYRPASVPWPRTANGEAMVFFGQVCFADSEDVVDVLPGDVLLIFTHGEHDHTSGELVYEWYPLGLEGLITAADIPDTAWRVFPCYMHLLRYVEDEEDEDSRCPEQAKIGGRPHWIQSEPRKPGEFLAGFECVDFLGKPDASDPKVKHLDFFDAGLLHFFLQEDGHIVEYFQCY